MLSAGTALANRKAKGSICRISVFFAEIKSFLTLARKSRFSLQSTSSYYEKELFQWPH